MDVSGFRLRLLSRCGWKAPHLLDSFRDALKSHQDDESVFNDQWATRTSYLDEIEYWRGAWGNHPEFAAAMAPYVTGSPHDWFMTYLSKLERVEQLAWDAINAEGVPDELKQLLHDVRTDRHKLELMKKQLPKPRPEVNSDPAQPLALNVEVAKPIPASASNKAVVYLEGPSQICDVLGVPDEQWRSVLDANKKFNGPIVTSRGAKARVIRAELILWWNGLQDQRKEKAEQERMTQHELTAHFGKDSTYKHGRTGIDVAPAIDGTIRRRSRKPTT